MQPIEDEYNQLLESEDGNRKDLLIKKNYVKKAFSSCQFWGQNHEFVEDAINEYSDFLQAFSEIELSKIEFSDITFGQFIDCKLAAQHSEAGKWNTIWIMMGVFDADAQIDYNMQYAASWAKSWDEFNNEVNTRFTLFHDSGEDEGHAMSEHMKRWGWINFLKSIAKTKVFDIAGSGMNSIDCARAANLEDVLGWASEEKDYNIALMRDMKK